MFDIGTQSSYSLFYNFIHKITHTISKLYIYYCATQCVQTDFTHDEVFIDYIKMYIYINILSYYSHLSLINMCFGHIFEINIKT